jgi:fumarate reductase flavoprotein subunit
MQFRSDLDCENGIQIEGNKDIMSHGQIYEEDLILYTDSADSLLWDIEVDVLVIGAGGCGLVASLAVAEKGAKVFVVEKEKAAGGNTSLSQAMVPAAGTRFQNALGVDDSIELMTEDILKKNESQSDPELTRHVARESAIFVEWLSDSIGITLDLVTEFLYPGHSRYRIHANKARKGAHLVTDLLKATARYENIDIAYNAPVKRLIATRSDGAVVGAEVEIEGIGRNLAKAKKVILALNGFGANREMLRKYIPEMSDADYFGHEGNTGEGILWGEALGAELECMGAYQAHGSVAHPHGTLLTWAAISLGGYQVNVHGKRFVNEYHGYSEHALEVLAQEEGVAIEVFDQRIYDTVLAYEDFQQCLKMGAIKKFRDIEELANYFRLPKEEVLCTHEKFQKAASGKASDSLGREEFGEPLEPPLYGAKVTGALFHTQGGLKINRKGEVIRKDGSSIPNLYAGGGTAAGFSGKAGPRGYLSANGLLAALVLGKIVGEEAGKTALQAA